MSPDIQDHIVRHYREVQRWDKPRLLLGLKPFTLTSTTLGLGDTLVLTGVLRSAERVSDQVSIFSHSSFFGPICSMVPYPPAGPSPLMVAADLLVRAFDVGNGHIIQRLQRAFGYEPDLLPRAYLKSEGTTSKRSVVLHFEPGAHVGWQRKNLHPRAREIYQESQQQIQTFISSHSEMNFHQVGIAPLPLEGVSDWTGLSLRETVARMSTCEYFVGIPSGPMHVAAALGLKMITIVNLPAVEEIVLPSLLDRAVPELEWLYPQSVILHQEGATRLVPKLSRDTLEAAFAGDVYPFWSDDYLGLIRELPARSVDLENSIFNPPAS